MTMTDHPGRPGQSGGVDAAGGAGVCEVEVGPFRVFDGSRRALVDRVVALTVAGGDQPVLAFALHVGGLNHRHDRDHVLAMRQADVVYADGGSVVWLARLAGGTEVERAPTTDVGWDVLRALAVALGRTPRVALLGGPDGLARRAGQVLAEAGVAEAVLVEHGYHEDWAETLAAVRAAEPDVVVVGLGAPREMVWCVEHRAELPAALVLTCGGWFGYVAGEEHRAPRLLRRSGVEWLARVAQQPTRLGPRYARGIGSTAVVAVATLRRGRRREA